MLSTRNWLAAATAAALIAAPAGAADVVRYPLPNGSTFPISAAVEVPAGKTLVYLSGFVPPLVKADAPKDSVAAYGDTEAQTVGVLHAIEAELATLKLGFGDVITMRVYLVGDPATGNRMDFAGFMRGYTRFFGPAAEKRLPTRAVVQVAGLANPGFLVEIEVTAARP
jgi:enamine deaminase RidA (YjgF/YER057c/UK114 family)